MNRAVWLSVLSCVAVLSCICLDDCSADGRVFEAPPPAGVHPRVLFNPDDLDEIKNRLENTKFGRARASSAAATTEYTEDTERTMARKVLRIGMALGRVGNETRPIGRMGPIGPIT